MANVQIEIQGKGAQKAAEELLATPGIEAIATPEQPERIFEQAGAIALNLAVGVSATFVASRVEDWYRKNKKAQSSTQIEQVVMRVDDKRFVLKNITPEELRQLFKED